MIRGSLTVYTIRKIACDQGLLSPGWSDWCICGLVEKQWVKQPWLYYLLECTLDVEQPESADFVTYHAASEIIMLDSPLGLMVANKWVCICSWMCWVQMTHWLSIYEGTWKKTNKSVWVLIWWPKAFVGNKLTNTPISNIKWWTWSTTMAAWVRNIVIDPHCTPSFTMNSGWLTMMYHETNGIFMNINLPLTIVLSLLSTS